METDIMTMTDNLNETKMQEEVKIKTLTCKVLVIVGFLRFFKSERLKMLTN